MIVGCIKEKKKHEYRVGMTPGNASEYILHGHKVLIETGTGEGSSFTDEQYAAAGAELVRDAKDVWSKADLLVKVKEPLPEEYGYMRKGQIIYAYFHLASDRGLTEAVAAAGVKAVAYETITDKNGGLPLLTPMSEVAGRLSIQEGAKYLGKISGGKGILLAGVPGTPRGRVLILGGGVVGLNACRMAIGVGADVTVMDINLDRLRYFDDVFGNLVKTRYNSEDALVEELRAADLVIGAVLIPGAKAPTIVRREHLKLMKQGTVMIDVAVDQGGCIETTKTTYHDNPTFVVDGIIHYCVGNMPGAVPNTSTVALTNATLRNGLLIADNGVERACELNQFLRPGINVYEGRITHEGVAGAFGMAYTPLETVLGKSL